MTRNDQNEVVLVLSQEEYDYMFKLLLDYGAYAPPENMRTKLARKIAKPALVRDDRMPGPFSWLLSLFARMPKASNVRKTADSSWNPA